MIFVLDGCSSSGKSSLARALQQTLPHAILHLQLDSFRAMEPTGYFETNDVSRTLLRIAALCRAMHAAVREYSVHGQYIIFDHVLSPVAWQYLLEDLQNLPVYLLSVECDIDQLEKREALRPDRKPGLARSQWQAMHTGRQYDFTVNTTHTSVQQCAVQVRDWLNRSPRARAYAKMCHESNAL